MSDPTSAPPAYTDADVQAAQRIVVREEDARAVLDAVAPAIAARALRAAADDLASEFYTPTLRIEAVHVGALRARADGIEAAR